MPHVAAVDTVPATAAAAALRRAEITAQFAKNWSPKDEEKDDDSTTSSSSSLEESEMTERISSPSPSLMRRSRSNSPGKTVTFCEESLETAEVNEIEENRSLNELDTNVSQACLLFIIQFSSQLAVNLSRCHSHVLLRSARISGSGKF